MGSVTLMTIAAGILLVSTGCFRFEGEHLDGEPPPATGEGGGGSDGLPVCHGRCYGGPTDALEGPSMVWFGPEGRAPDCPDYAPLAGFEGHAGFDVKPSQCPECSCSPAACALPESMVASAAKCSDANGAMSTTFDAPADGAWEGTCTSENAIDGGLDCGGVPCVQSITIAAPSVEPCTATSKGEVVLPEPTWQTMSRQCRITLSNGCEVQGEVCAPVPPEGFVMCLHRAGDDPEYKCPDDYRDRKVVYAGVKDSRACAPCTCGAPKGAECWAMVSVFTDGACGALLGDFPVSDEVGCFDVPSGVALGSKEAVLTVDKQGVCAPGGGLSGEVVRSGAMTYCCKPEEVSP